MTSLNVKEMQIKATLRFHFSPIWLMDIKKLVNIENVNARWWRSSFHNWNKSIIAAISEAVTLLISMRVC